MPSTRLIMYLELLLLRLGLDEPLHVGVDASAAARAAEGHGAAQGGGGVIEGREEGQRRGEGAVDHAAVVVGVAVQAAHAHARESLVFCCCDFVSVQSASSKNSQRCLRFTEPLIIATSSQD